MYKEWFSDEENKTKIPNLLGKKVVATRHFYGGPFNECWVITFNDGSMLSAKDGEYGTDSFYFLTPEELVEKAGEHISLMEDHSE